ncbi:MAG: UDP-3-O-(3-hydroxymyristoyl)glucosamine N-acyltransferase [Bdellovibrio sp. CG10_big_fil_rev_8_21_14_0_10_47_8]|nr:MAG: UDP-3-O-(3-hydroxymyristoyl)glucosamine N-acyltransferase [Bdellovibrio sp. CG10_big_fil_rev_8_21_14_0_10_47_8]
MPQSVQTSQLKELAANPHFSSYLQFISGQDKTSAELAVEPGRSGPQKMSFVSTEEQWNQAVQNQVSILIAHEKLSPKDRRVDSSISLFATSNMPATFAIVLPLFDQKKSRFRPGIHPTAAIDPSAQISPEVRIGAFVVIGPDAIIEEGAMIGAQTVVEKGASVGAKTILHSQVFVGADCKVGRFCEIHPHTTIGADGFGFVPGPDSRMHKIPQLGIVVIEDFVEIGANCAIDRATLGETRIGEGTKFDNLCHVAHNCKIGKHNVFAGGFFVAGSTNIGDHCVFGGSVAVGDHISIADRVTVGGRSAVTKSIRQSGTYAGYPLESFTAAKRTLANSTYVSDLRKQVSEIRKHLKLGDKRSSAAKENK